MQLLAFEAALAHFGVVEVKPVKKTESSDSMEKIEKRVALATVVIPFGAFVVATILLWGRAVSALDLLLCALMYLVTGFGVTLGFHRFFTHRSFKCAWPLAACLGVAGSMSGQGPILFWTACHRRHHQSSDRADDPHSPHGFGTGLVGVLKGWWHAHTGWMLSHKTENYRRLVGDLIRDRRVMAINRYYLVWVALGLFIPGTLGGLLTGSWWGFLTGLLWGGLVRMFLVHHTTWSINSICHLFGAAPFPTSDESRNNAVCAVLTFGEGWHNNHHAFPSSARHGLWWWQLDIIYLVVGILKFCRLAWDVRQPHQHEIEERRNPPQRQTALNTACEESSS